MIVIPHIPEQFRSIVRQGRCQSMAVTVVFKSFPTRPRRLCLSQTHDLHGLSEESSTSFRRKAVEIQSEDRINIENNSRDQVTVQRIFRIFQRFEFGIVEREFRITIIQQRSRIAGIIYRTAGLHLYLAFKTIVRYHLVDNKSHGTVDTFIHGKSGIRPLFVIDEIIQCILQGFEYLFIRTLHLITVYRDAGIQLLRLTYKGSSSQQAYA